MMDLVHWEALARNARKTAEVDLAVDSHILHMEEGTEDNGWVLGSNLHRNCFHKVTVEDKKSCQAAVRGDILEVVLRTWKSFRRVEEDKKNTTHHRIRGEVRVGLDMILHIEGRHGDRVDEDHPWDDRRRRSWEKAVGLAALLRPSVQELLR